MAPRRTCRQGKTEIGRYEKEEEPTRWVRTREPKGELAGGVWRKARLAERESNEEKTKGHCTERREDSRKSHDAKGSKMTISFWSGGLNGRLE